MLNVNAFSIKGKNAVPYDESYCIIPFPERNVYILSVASGRRCQRHSALAAEIASESAAVFVYKNFPRDITYDNMTALLRTAFNRAVQDILSKIPKAAHLQHEYDTSLTLAVYDGKRGYYASVGNSGIIGLNKNGRFFRLTRYDKDKSLSLLSDSKNWDIGCFDDEFPSITLATDGIMNTLCNKNQSMAALMLLCDPYVIENIRKTVNYSDFIANPKAFAKEAYNALYKALYRDYGFKQSVAISIVASIKKYGMPFLLLDSIHTDKTAITIYNPKSTLSPASAIYYKEPDWDMLSPLERR